MIKNYSEQGSNVIRVDFNQKKPEPALGKRQLFNDWLAYGIVTLVFDASRHQVEVPPDLRPHKVLRLNFSYNFHVADFSFNDIAVWASLSFADGEYFCRVPWAAVFAIQSEKLKKGAVWLQEFPEDLHPQAILGMSEEDYLRIIAGKKIGDEISHKNNILPIEFLS